MVLWDSIVGSLLGKVAPAVAEYYQKKLELKHKLKLTKIEGEIRVEEAKIQRAERSEERDHEWEQMQISNSGWKDEWVLILLSIPLVMAFIPFAAPYVGDGFAVLADTPEWYRWLILLIFTAIYGIRIWRRKYEDTSV
jgi:hypothetical protein